MSTLANTLYQFRKRESDLSTSLDKALHRRNYDRLLGREQLPKNKSERIPIIDRYETHGRFRNEMYVVNRASRVLWGTEFLRHVFEHFGLGDDGRPWPKKPVYFVTLADARHAHEHGADAPDMADVRASLEARFPEGCSFVGMVEAGYYVNFAPAIGRRRPMVSWHCHAIVWGISRRALKERVTKLNGGPQLPGPCAEWHLSRLYPCAKPAHFKRVKPGQLGAKLAYLLKSPSKEYSVAPYKNGYRSWARDIRPGNQVRLFRSMRQMRLPELAIAGGDGVKILRAIKLDIAAMMPRRQPTDRFNTRVADAASIRTRRGS